MYDYFYGKEGEQYSFYRIPKALFTRECFEKMTTDAKILYGLLLDRVSLSAENGWMDADGKVYIIYTLEEVMKSLNCADKKATALSGGKGAAQMSAHDHFADPNLTKKTQ